MQWMPDVKRNVAQKTFVPGKNVAWFNLMSCPEVTDTVSRWKKTPRLTENHAFKW